MAVLLVLVGFIGAGGGCVLTPAMVAIGVPGIAPFLAPSSC